MQEKVKNLKISWKRLRQSSWPFLLPFLYLILQPQGGSILIDQAFTITMLKYMVYRAKSLERQVRTSVCRQNTIRRLGKFETEGPISFKNFLSVSTNVESRWHYLVFDSFVRRFGCSIRLSHQLRCPYSSFSFNFFIQISSESSFFKSWNQSTQASSDILFTIVVSSDRRYGTLMY